MEGLEATVGLALTQTQATHCWLLDLLSPGENYGGSQQWGRPMGALTAASPPGLARWRQALEKTKLPGFEEPETPVLVTPASALFRAAEARGWGCVEGALLPLRRDRPHTAAQRTAVLQGGCRRSSFLPFSRTSARGGTWRFKSAWAIGARRGPVRSACPFTGELERLGPLPTGGDGVRGDQARTPAHGRGCGVRPQAGVKCSGLPGAG